MLAEWTWPQLVHDIGIGLAAIVAAVCIAYLANKGASVVLKRRQFSVFDLLVALTAVAALAGFISGILNEDNKGIPRIRPAREIDRLIEENQQQEK